MKRFISVLVVLCCLIGLCPMQAGAALDTDSPLITGAYLSAPGVELKAGEELRLVVSATDANDINYVSAFAYPVGDDGKLDQSYSVSFHADGTDSVDYDSSTGTFVARAIIGDDDLNGIYYLNEIIVADQYGNQARIGRSYSTDVDFTSLWFSVTGNSTDKNPPEILSAQLSYEGAILQTGDTIDLLVSASDESDIQYVSCFAYPVDENGEMDRRYSVSFHAYGTGSKDCDSVTGIFSAHATIEDGDQNGTYFVYEIIVADKYGNQSRLSKYSESNIDFTRLSFAVSGNSVDKNLPEILSAQLVIEGATYKTGDKLDLVVTAFDESDIQYVSCFAYPVDENGELDRRYSVSFHAYGTDSKDYDSSTGAFTAHATINSDNQNGTYFIYEIIVADKYGNQGRLSSVSASSNVDFTKLWFIVASTDIQPEKVSLPESIQLPVRSVYTITPDVVPVESIPTWTWESEDSSIATANVAGNGSVLQITGLKVGTTTITGKTSNNLTAYTVVTVTDAPVPEEGKVEDSYCVGVSEFVDIHPELLPPGATSQYDVTSDNPHVASVDITSENNTIRIRGNNAGKAIITICGANGITMTTTIIVGKPTDRQHEKVVVEGYESTCTSHGRSDAERCSACYYYFKESEELPLAPHKEETVPGWEATCTQTGRTDAVRCSYCYTYLVEPKEIPMKPHTFSEWEIVVEATDTTEGLRSRTCKVCGHYEMEEYSLTPEPEQTPEPTPTPSQASTPEPSPTDTPSSTTAPMPESTTTPEPESTAIPSPNPTAEPTAEPTPAPTATVDPSPEPTKLQVDVGDQNIDVTVGCC